MRDSLNRRGRRNHRVHSEARCVVSPHGFSAPTPVTRAVMPFEVQLSEFANTPEQKRKTG